MDLNEIKTMRLRYGEAELLEYFDNMTITKVGGIFQGYINDKLVFSCGIIFHCFNGLDNILPNDLDAQCREDLVWYFIGKYYDFKPRMLWI